MKKFFQILTIVALVACCYGCETPAPDPVKVDSVTLNESSITLTVGDSYSLVATVLPADAKDNGDGTWSAKSSTAMGASTYTFYVEPLPAEGHGLINDKPSSIEIILHKYDKTGFSYRFMLEEVEEGVEYETACYDLEVKYKNIQFLKSDKTQPIVDNWYIYHHPC